MPHWCWKTGDLKSDWLKKGQWHMLERDHDGTSSECWRWHLESGEPSFLSCPIIHQPEQSSLAWVLLTEDLELQEHSRKNVQCWGGSWIRGSASGMWKSMVSPWEIPVRIWKDELQKLIRFLQEAGQHIKVSGVPSFMSSQHKESCNGETWLEGPPLSISSLSLKGSVQSLPIGFL